MEKMYFEQMENIQGGVNSENVQGGPNCFLTGAWLGLAIVTSYSGSLMNPILGSYVGYCWNS